MKMLSYKDAIGILFGDASFEGRGPKHRNTVGRQERMYRILRALGNPQDSFRAVHVTGTKGKGSTSAYTESILRHLGCHTGLFTSPHLFTFRERIRVAGHLIGQGAFANLVEQALPHFKAIPDLTIFDRITALAFLYFAQAQVEWAVVEVGVGGRFDSTNVLQPAVCGITRISKDHMHILGDTIEEIAEKKAGIIKTGTPVFSAPQRQEARDVLQREARLQTAPLTEVQLYQRADLPLVGRHQQVNAGIAFEMVQELHRLGLVPWDDQRVNRGLAHTWWPCRIEEMPQPKSDCVPLVVDCAHNIDSLEILLSTLAVIHPQRPFTLIFGVNRDKDITPMLARVMASTAALVLVQSRHPKAMPVPKLREALAAMQTSSTERTIISAPSMKAALEAGTCITPPQGYLLGTGSVFVAAELREAWNERHPGLFPAHDWIHEANTDPPLAPLPPAYGSI